MAKEKACVHLCVYCGEPLEPAVDHSAKKSKEEEE